jgi:hypothetical protein
MTLAFLYWFILLLSLLLGAYTNRGALGTPFVWGWNLLLIILLCIIGLQLFGPPIH